MYDYNSLVMMAIWYDILVLNLLSLLRDPPIKTCRSFVRDPPFKVGEYSTLLPAALSIFSFKYAVNRQIWSK